MVKKLNYHTPVLLTESIEWLDINPEGVYIDATYGGGGHSKSILNQMNAKGRLFGFDQDEQAQSNVIDDPRFCFIQANFRFVAHFMRFYDFSVLDGILADLGVSSFHFDEPSRGFSYRYDALLDMRMNQSSSLTARRILWEYDAPSLQSMFSDYAELRNAKSLSEKICSVRDKRPLEKVSDLIEVIDALYIGDRLKYMSQVFQALRIEVNDEMNALKIFLEHALQLLKKKGRLVVISYHSVEDKLVKNVFRDYAQDYDEYGRLRMKATILTKKPIAPSKEEILENRRASSAKLRVLEKL